MPAYAGYTGDLLSDVSGISSLNCCLPKMNIFNSFSFLLLLHLVLVSQGQSNHIDTEGAKKIVQKTKSKPLERGKAKLLAVKVENSSPNPTKLEGSTPPTFTTIIPPTTPGEGRKEESKQRTDEKEQGRWKEKGE